ncbi:MAG: MauE/DoxX family redox-associated membrane protein [Ornithinibacter sp.]
MPSPLLLPVLTVSVVLLLSGLAKLRDPDSLERAFTSLEVPSALSAPLVRRLVPWAEIALGVSLLLATGPALVVAAALSLLVFVAYLVLVVRAVRRPEPADCGCFGAIGDSRVSAATVWRNLALVLSAALAVVAGTQGVGLLGALAEGSALGWIAMAALTAAVAVLVTWRSGDVEPAGVDSGREPITVDEDGEYVRRPVPRAQVLTDGGQLELVERAASRSAHLLVFLNPGCGACQRIGPDLEQWGRELDPVVVQAVLRGEPRLVEFYEYLRGRAWFDPHGMAGEAFGVPAPSAVLVGADGLLAGGPVSGEDDIREFVAEIAEHLAGAGAVVDEPSELVSDELVSDDR